MPTVQPSLGFALGIATYIMWGLFPLYFKAIEMVPPLEVVVHRAIWSALFGFLLLQVWRHPGWLRELRDNPKRLAVLVVSGLLIASNWLMYVWAVNNGHIVDVSLGYYVNPLVNVLLGVLLLGERLRRLQWSAVSLVVLGVLQHVWQVGSIPWVSLVLALTFGFYGLIRKQAPVAALPGLVVETWLLLPLAFGWLLFHPAATSAQGAFWGSSDAFWLIAAGPITLLPLLCFNAAVRHLSYATNGLLQYITPTLVLLQAVFLFGENLESSTLTLFACIWVALFIYSLDIWLNMRQRRLAMA